MNSLPRVLTVALAVVSVLAGCSDDFVTPLPQDADPAVQKLAEMGFRTDMIENHGDYFVVEGDIRFTRAQLLQPAPAAPRPGGPRFQYTTNALVTGSNIQTIKVDLSGISSDAGYVQAVRDAIGYWSSISSSYIKIVEGSPANIYFVFQNLGTGVMGQGDFPSGGMPGDTIRFNPNFTVSGSAPSQAAKVKTAVHELGHNIGFRHSNWNQVDCYPFSCSNNPGSAGANQVSGTPSSGNDGNSVMNGGTAGTAWAGFSTYDQAAARIVYPLPYPTASGSHPSGTLVVSWSAVTGADWYEVETVEEYSISDYEMGNSSTRYEGGWTTASGLSYNTGATWTGTSNCTWLDSMYRTERSDYYVAVRAHFATGYGPAFWVYDETHTC